MFCPKSKQYSVQKLSNIPLPLQYGDDQHVNVVYLNMIINQYEMSVGYL